MMNHIKSEAQIAAVMPIGQDFTAPQLRALLGMTNVPILMFSADLRKLRKAGLIKFVDRANRLAFWVRVREPIREPAPKPVDNRIERVAIGGSNSGHSGTDGPKMYVSLPKMPLLRSIEGTQQ